MFDQDKLNFALTKKSLDILSSLVDKRSSKTSYDGEKLVGSTISSVFHLFDGLRSIRIERISIGFTRISIGFTRDL